MPAGTEKSEKFPAVGLRLARFSRIRNPQT